MERNTRQRDAVLAVLSGSTHALTPIEICKRAKRAVPRISLSTVYRQLGGLLEDGEVLRLDLTGQPTHYEAMRSSGHDHDSKHHHHFHCNACDRIYPIDGCPGPMKNLVPKGFKVEGHEITLRGRCSRCGPAGASA